MVVGGKGDQLSTPVGWSVGGREGKGGEKGREEREEKRRKKGEHAYEVFNRSVSPNALLLVLVCVCSHANIQTVFLRFLCPFPKMLILRLKVGTSACMRIKANTLISFLSPPLVINKRVKVINTPLSPLLVCFPWSRVSWPTSVTFLHRSLLLFRRNIKGPFTSSAPLPSPHSFTHSTHSPRNDQPSFHFSSVSLNLHPPTYPKLPPRRPSTLGPPCLLPSLLPMVQDIRPLHLAALHIQVPPLCGSFRRPGGGTTVLGPCGDDKGDCCSGTGWAGAAFGYLEKWNEDLLLRHQKRIQEEKWQQQQEQEEPALLFRNQLTRLDFHETGPRFNSIPNMFQWTNYKVIERLISWNKTSLQAIHIFLHLKTVLFYNQHVFRNPTLYIADMHSLTSLTLKGASASMSVFVAWRLFVTCPEQLQVLKVEHLCETIAPYTKRTYAHHIVDKGQTENLTPPFLFSPTNLPGHNCLFLNCICLEGLDEMVWPLVTPTQIRVLALPNISDNERFRPILVPFLQRRCPKLQTLKLRNLGTTSLDLLRPVLSRDAFLDLRHLELDGIRRNQATIYQDMFPIYSLLLKETFFERLESLTISPDSDLIDDVPQFVNMVLKSHARTLKTLRWLGPAGIGLDDRLDLEWFLYACPNLERVEITNDNRFCSSGQRAVGTIIIPDHDPSTSPLPVPTTAKTLPNLSKLGLTSWACTTTLKYLDISFRPSSTINDDLQYRIQIESFYKKLGQLTALVELHIGCECRCRGPQLQTCQHTICPEGRVTAATPTTTHPPTTPSTPIFDMSLSTGLAHMAGLQNLEILNISRIHRHNIQTPELEWMKTHWSGRLRILQGTKRHWISDWLQKNWPELETRWCNCDYARWKDDWRVYRPIVKI